MDEVDCNLTELAKGGPEMRDFVNTKLISQVLLYSRKLVAYLVR